MREKREGRENKNDIVWQKMRRIAFDNLIEGISVKKKDLF